MGQNRIRRNVGANKLAQLQCFRFDKWHVSSALPMLGDTFSPSIYVLAGKHASGALYRRQPSEYPQSTSFTMICFLSAFVFHVTPNHQSQFHKTIGKCRFLEYQFIRRNSYSRTVGCSFQLQPHAEHSRAGQLAAALVSL